MAAEKGMVDMVQILLNNKKTECNMLNIILYHIKFHIILC